MTNNKLMSYVMTGLFGFSTAEMVESMFPPLPLATFLFLVGAVFFLFAAVGYYKRARA